MNYQLPDDVAKCDLMRDKKKTKLNRYDFTQNINYDNKNELLNTIISNNNYHIKNIKNKFSCIFIMKEVQSYLYQIFLHILLQVTYHPKHNPV